MFDRRKDFSLMKCVWSDDCSIFKILDRMAFDK